MDYATRVKALRTIQGLSQTGLADVSGIANFDLSKIETGKMLPNPEWDVRIREALCWTPAVDAALDALAAALGIDHAAGDCRGEHAAGTEAA